MIEIEIIAMRACTACGQTVEVNLAEVQNRLKDTTPWLMFHTLLFEMPKVECCQIALLPTHIKVKSHGPQDDGIFPGKTKLKIGSEEVPVIFDEAGSFAYLRSFKDQLELDQQLLKQNKLWERQKEDFFHKAYTYFSVHFEQIIDEMDHLEVLDILRTFEDGYIQTNSLKPKRFVYKGKNERKLITKWIKKEIKSLAYEESEEVQKYLFFLIVEYFVQLKLIPQIHYLKWDSKKYEKMIGESLLIYLLVSFPLTSYFSFLKDEAILRLTKKGHFQNELRKLLEKTQKDLATTSSNNVKMQLTLESQRKVMTELEVKNEKLRMKNSQLEERINETSDELLLARQAIKIKELKGLLNEMQEEIKQLRGEVTECSQEKDSICEEVNDVVIEGETSVNQVKDYSLLNGKTIGIFGDIQGYQNDDELFPCNILSCESLKNPSAVGILKESDIVVVLTQHIAHSCMWSIKEYANQHNLPVIYSRHTNVEIILDQVLEAITT